MGYLCAAIRDWSKVHLARPPDIPRDLPAKATDDDISKMTKIGEELEMMEAVQKNKRPTVQSAPTPRFMYKNIFQKKLTI